MSWSLLATAYWLRDEDGIEWSNFLLEFALEFPYVYYVPPLLSDRLHLARDTAAEEEFDIAIQIRLEQVSSEIPENRNERKN